MQALWIENNRVFERSVPCPAIQDGEALLKVSLAGLCGTDLELLQGYHDFVGIPGHEFVARVISGPSSWLGRRVVVDINIGCGDCEYCRRSEHKHCRSRTVIGIKNRPGAFAEKLVAPVTNLIPLPDNISDLQAVLVEPLAAALQIIEQVDLRHNTRTLIVGAGRLANLVGCVLQQQVNDLSVCIRSPSRIAAFDSYANILRPEQITKEYDCVIDCSGSPSGFELALKAVRPKGHLVIKSTYAEHLTLDMSRIVVDEICVLGSRCGPMDKAIEWLAKGKIDMPSEIKEFSLTDHDKAYEAARDPEISKVVFRLLT